MREKEELIKKFVSIVKGIYLIKIINLWFKKFIGYIKYIKGIVIIWLERKGYSKFKGIFIYLKDHFIVFISSEISNESALMIIIMIIILYKK